MISAGIREIKNNLSRILAQVKAGEEIVITERGKPVARIVKEGNGDQSIRGALAPLVGKGLVVMPSRSLRKGRLDQVKAPGKPVSEMVIEDRR